MPRNTPVDRKKKQRRTRLIKKLLRIFVIALIVITVLVICIVLIKTLIEEDKPPVIPGSDTESEQMTSDDTSTSTSSSGNETNADTKPSVPEVVYEGYTCITVDNELEKYGPLVLVNASHSYFDIDGTKLNNLFSSNSSNHFSLSSSSVFLLPDAYDALIKMTDDCYESEKYENLQILSAYRTYEEQKKFYDDNVSSSEDKDYYEQAGYSDHHTGYSFDVKIYDAKNEISYPYASNAQTHAKWIDDNYKYYGFIIRYPENRFEDTGKKEENHFRYIGYPHSVYITENNLCLDGYVTRMSEYTLDSEPLNISVGDDTYTVYFVPCSDTETTDVYVPVEKEYSISGTNNNGFIIWYKDN